MRDLEIRVGNQSYDAHSFGVDKCLKSLGDKPMPFSRRGFMKWAASVSAFAATSRSHAKMIPFFMDGQGTDFRSALLPSQKEVWDNVKWMAKLGPKFTGNAAHTRFVEFLATQLQSLGLDLTRDRYTFPRWEAKRWGISIQPTSGQPFKVPVTSYWPYSGQTPAEGVTGELVYGGTHPAYQLSGVQGKIVFVDFANEPAPWGEWYQPWGVLPSGTDFPPKAPMIRSPINKLGAFQKAGAAGVILGWTNISDSNAADQYTPFGATLQNVPALYVGMESGSKLKAMAGSSAKATLVLEADVFPNTPTDTLLATLPGSSADEVIIVNTHTDGSNALQENGGLGILALAKYFSRIPKSERKRTMVFVLATGHFANSYVPSIRGVIDKHPDLIQKVVAALAVEHLGAREWADDAALNYRPTGQDEWMLAITRLKSTGDVMLEAFEGLGKRRFAAINPVKAGFLGEGNALSMEGVPSVGFMVAPDYLCTTPESGCIEKLSPELMHAQLQALAKALHKMDVMSAAELKGQKG